MERRLTGSRSSPTLPSATALALLVRAAVDDGCLTVDDDGSVINELAAGGWIERIEDASRSIGYRVTAEGYALAWTQS